MSAGAGRRLALMASMVFLSLSVIGGIGDAWDAWASFLGWAGRETGLTLPWGPGLSLVIAVLLVAVLLTGLGLLVGAGPAAAKGSEPGAVSGAGAPTRRDTHHREVRRKYLELLKREVANRLRASVHHAVRLDLHLAERAGATVPWHFVAKLEGEEERAFGSFDEAVRFYGGRLLLLGHPGSGKTTTVLQYAEKLIDAALADDRAPIPLLESLSRFHDLDGPVPRRRFGWRGESRPREDRSLERQLVRLVSHLRVRGLSEDVVAEWIESGRVVLLLDGLDEVGDGYLPVMAEHLNRMFERYPDTPVVVASRLREYQPLEGDREAQLKMAGAVATQALNAAQIDAYLEAAGASTLRGALLDDAVLYELARNPLTLSMMVLAYRGIAAQEIRSELPILERRRELFDRYIDQMMQREAHRRAGRIWNPAGERLKPLYSLEQVSRYLGWLAVTLSGRMQTRLPSRRFAAFLRARAGAGVPPRQEGFWSWMVIATVFTAFVFTALLVLGLAVSTGSPRGPYEIGGLLLVPPLVVLGLRFAGWHAEPEPLKWMRRSRLAAGTGLWLAASIAYGIAAVPLTGIVDGVMGRVPAALLLSLLPVTVLLYGLAHESFPRSPAVVRFPMLASAAGALLLGSGVAVLCGSGAHAGILAGIGAATGLVALSGLLGALRHMEVEYRRITVAVGTSSLLTFTLLGWSVPAVIGEEFWATAFACVFVLSLAASEERSRGLPLVVVPAALGASAWAFPGGLVAGTLIALLLGAALAKQLGALTDRLLIGPILLSFPKVAGRLPWRFGRFLSYSADVLLLREVGDEVEFVHMLLRDHFAVRGLAPRLGDPDPETRIVAIRELSRQGETALETIGSLIDDPDVVIRAEAVRALGRIPSPAVTPLVLEAMEADRSLPVRLAALESLNRLPEEDAVALIGKARNDPEPEVRARLVGELVQSARYRFSEDLVKLLKDPDPRVVRAVLEGLGAKPSTFHSRMVRSTDALVELLRSFLTDESPLVRIGAILALGHMAPGEVADVLAGRFDLEEVGPREAIAKALGLSRDVKTIPVLVRGLRDPRGNICLTSTTSLQLLLALPGADAHMPQVTEVLLRTIPLQRGVVKARLVETLGGVQPMPRVVRALLSAARDRSAAVRVAAIGSMGRLGLPEFVEPLIRSLGFEKTRRSAILALAQLPQADVVSRLSAEVASRWSRRQLGAISALAEMNDNRAASVLRAHLSRFRTPAARRVDRWLEVARLPGLPTGSREASCLWALTRLDLPSAISFVREGLESPVPAVRAVSISALARFEGPAAIADFLARGEDLGPLETNRAVNELELMAADRSTPEQRMAIRRALVHLARRRDAPMAKVHRIMRLQGLRERDLIVTADAGAAASPSPRED